MTLSKSNNEHFVSGLSLKSIQYKKELEASLSRQNVNPEDLPKDDYSLEDVIVQWNKMSQKFFKTGRMLMSSIMNMSAPKLEDNLIVLELPNEGSKISFEENKYELVNRLRKSLNNYQLDIKIIVNEEMKIKKAFTIEDKFNRLKELNPALSALIKTFNLEIKQ